MGDAAAETPRRHDLRAALASLFWRSLASICLSLGVWRLVQRAALAPLLAFGGRPATESEALLVAWTAVAETLLLLELGALVSAAANRLIGLARAELGFAVWSGLGCAWVTLDTHVYAAFGRHALELLRFAFLPGAAQIAGDGLHWVLLFFWWALLGAVATYACSWLGRQLVERAARRLSLDFARVLGGLFAFGACAALALPGFAQGYYSGPALREALRASLLWGPSLIGSGLDQSSGWAALDASMKQTYRREFSRVFSAHPRSFAPPAAPTRLSVLLIVLESFRQDSLTPERMPRLYAWAQQGLIAKQHYAGSTFSEAGMFALLFGRSPLLYHSTLDHKEPPTWCSLAHAFGMDCAYYSGQPRQWLRLEEFLNPSVVDHYHHDDNGGWNDWDRRALHGAVDAIRAGTRPSFTTVYLMSTHFEYQYPDSYARHMPVMTDVKWPKTNILEMDVSNRERMTNRYLNALAFTDDLVADTIAQVDPSRTIVIVTGDHGESLGDDGRFGHAYSFVDAVTTVPFVMVGPGIPAGPHAPPSMHADLLRTVAHALGGKLATADGTDDLLAPGPARTSFLLAHCSVNHDVADAVLLGEDRRIRLTLGLQEPTVKIRGPENALGQPSDSNALSPDQERRLAAAFEHLLDGLR